MKLKTRRWKLPIIVESYRIWIFDDKTQKKMRFTSEYQNTETSFNCWQFPSFDYNWLNTKKKRLPIDHPNTDTNYNCELFPYFDYRW